MSKAKLVTLRRGPHAGETRNYGFDPGSREPDPRAAYMPAEEKHQRHGKHKTQGRNREFAHGARSMQYSADLEYAREKARL